MSARDILVIGGGIAGLTAAAELLQRGCRVTLIEARSRLGGRIFTIRDGGFPIELGAEFIHGRHKLLWQTVKEAKLATHQVPDRNQLYSDGSLQPVDLWEKVGQVFEAARPSAPDSSVRQFVENGPFDEWTRRLTLGFVEGFNAARAGRISTHAMLRADHAAEQIDGSAQFRIEDGYAALVNYVAAQVQNRNGTILTDCRATAVHWKRGYVDVAVERSGTTETFGADAAVIALPLGVLKRGAIAFDPALPDKSEAIQAMHLGHVVKVALTFREIWWPDRDFGFIHDFDAPLPTWWSDPRGPVLTAWAGGSKAESLMSRSSADLEEIALETIAKLLNHNSGAVRQQLVRSYTHHWASDPFARGAYSYIPVNGLDLPKTLAAPVDGTLFFAGEATVSDAQMGTVFGAMESGLRAAREIHPV
jgi:monoamine oxidase